MPKLIVISIPFYRIAKLTLSHYFLEQLASQNFKVVIVTPLMSDEFRAQFSKFQNIHFVEWQYPAMNLFERKVFAMSELLRRYGYLYKFQNNGLKYLYYNQSKIFGQNGNDLKRGLLSRIGIRFSNILGQFSKSWQLLNIIDFRTTTFGKLNKIVSDYDQVIFIQSSSWAEQDRILQKWVKKQNATNIFLPYTTDQLWTNGFLLGDYDFIYLQGQAEYRFAKDIHDIEDSKLIKSGSLWFRILDSLELKMTSQPAYSDKRTILYAGVADEYYPKEGEFEILRFLNSAIENEIISNSKILYRPYFKTQMDKEAIIAQLTELSHLEFQWIDMGLNEIENVRSVSLEENAVKVIRDFSKIDLLIMSGLTSIALDVAYLSKCAVISNFIDCMDVYLKRNAFLQLNEDGSVIGIPGCVTVSTKKDLLQKVLFYLNNREESEKMAEKIYSYWDYKSNSDIGNQLRQLSLK